MVPSIENAIIDKLGEKCIKWEDLGEIMMTRVNRITYEEVIDGGDNDTLETYTNKKRDWDLEWEQEHLKMADILLIWSELTKSQRRSSQKLAEAEEAAIAQNKIDDAAPQVSVAT